MLNDIKPYCDRVLFYVDKTATHFMGHYKFTRLTYSILKLAGEIWPLYQERLSPIVEDVKGYKNLCYALMIFPTLDYCIKTKKLTMESFFRIGVSLSLTIKYLMDVKIIDFSSASKISGSIGGEKSVLKNVLGVFSKYGKDICISIEASYVIAKLLFLYSRAATPQDKEKALGLEKQLLLINRISKLFIVGIGLKWKVPLLLSCIDTIACVASYSRFLISKSVY